MDGGNIVLLLVEWTIRSWWFEMDMQFEIVCHCDALMERYYNGHDENSEMDKHEQDGMNKNR